MTKPLKTINFGGEDTYHLAPDFKNIENAPCMDKTVESDTFDIKNTAPTIDPTGTMPYYYLDGITAEDLGNISLCVGMNGDKLEIPYVATEATVKENSDGSIDYSYTGELPVEFMYTPADDSMGLPGGIYYIYSLQDLGISFSSLESLELKIANGTFKTKVFKQLDNKYLEPFETVGGDTLTWDGNTDGRELVPLEANVYFCHVSDAVPTLEDIAGGTSGTVYYNQDGVEGEAQIPISGFQLADGCIMLVDGDDSTAGVVVSESVVGTDLEGWVFNRAGLYLMIVNMPTLFTYPSSLTINGYTGFPATKLKEEYIPVDYIKQLIAEVTGN